MHFTLQYSWTGDLVLSIGMDNLYSK
jgi:hypothetical protein